MIKFQSFSIKYLLIALIAILALTAIPVSNAAAAGLADDPSPDSGEEVGPHLREARVRIIFRRLNNRYERMSNLLDRSNTLIERAQNLIDKANEHDLDASGVQNALDDLLAVLPDIESAHAVAGEIIATHHGFDDEGNVTDLEAASATVQELRDALQTTRQSADGTVRALIEAIRNFIQENREVFQTERPAQP